MNDELKKKRHQFLYLTGILSEKKKEALALVWDMQDLFLKGSEQYKAIEQAQSLLLGIEIDVPDFDTKATDMGYAIGRRAGYHCPPTGNE